jgi:hypothetical protein
MTAELSAVTKVLSRNDIGLTGGHQAGITVPKTGPMLDFFPVLDPTQFNPRHSFKGVDAHTDEEFTLTYIYYNGRILKRSTRNEFRLTGLTSFFNRHHAIDGDTLWIECLEKDAYKFSIERKIDLSDELPEKIALTGSWSTIRKAAK